MRAWLGTLRGFRRPRPARAADRPAGLRPELLLRVLCHEFRTPVSTLTSVTRALADGRLSGDDRAALSALARDQAVHLADLLQEATASTGSLLLAAEREVSTAPLAEILRGVAVLIPGHRRRTRVTRRAGECAVPERRTRQVLANLVENALRHGPAGGTVGIHAALRRSGLSIVVTDEGQVDAALLAAVRWPAPGAGMSGLGLWIVRQLVAADGGQLRLHRLRPRGVALEVRFPGVRPAG